MGEGVTPPSLLDLQCAPHGPADSLPTPLPAQPPSLLLFSICAVAWETVVKNESSLAYPVDSKMKSKILSLEFKVLSLWPNLCLQSLGSCFIKALGSSLSELAIRKHTKLPSACAAWRRMPPFLPGSSQSPFPFTKSPISPPGHSLLWSAVVLYTDLHGGAWTVVMHQW